jgi:hypothetical protein
MPLNPGGSDEGRLESMTSVVVLADSQQAPAQIIALFGWHEACVCSAWTLDNAQEE